MNFQNMEKSMVREYNGLSHSQFLGNRSTFISTALNEGDDELRKSKIQNLPFYQKQDLSSRPQFVIVFQTIEIERLSEEVEALRVALKDAERQQFNLQNYEVQIRQLTEKCFAYENQREEYREEVDKLNLICERLYEELQIMNTRFADIDPTIKQKYRLEKERTQQLEEEVQKWRVRYNALETSKNREMEDMRLMMESQRKSMVDREIRELTIRFENEQRGLQNQIRKLREGLDQKNSQFQRLEAQNSKLKVHNQELQQCEDLVMEYQNKFAMITQQTVRLQDLLRHKQEEIQRLEGLEVKLKRRINQLENSLREAEEGGVKARQLENQVNQWRNRFVRVQQKNKQYQHELQKIPEFQMIIHQVNSESERLKDAVRQKIGEIDDWKNRCQRVEQQHRQSKIEEQKKIPVFQNKISQLNAQQNRLTDALSTRARQIQSLRTKLNDTERKANRLGPLEDQKRLLETKLQENAREFNVLENQFRDTQNQLRRMGDIESQLNRERMGRQESNREIQRLNGAVQEASQRAQDFRRKCENLQRQLQTFSQMEEQIRIHKQKQANLTRQLDRINGIITQKLRQIQILKETFAKFDAKINQYQGVQKKLIDAVAQVQKLIQELDESRKQSGFFQDKLVTAQSDIRKLKNDVYVLNEEKNQIVRLLNSKTQELEQTSAEINKLTGQLNILKQKQIKYRELQEHLRQLEAKAADQERKFAREQERNKSLNRQMEEKSNQLAKIKREGLMSPQFKEQFFALKMMSEKKDQEMRNLQLRIKNTEGIIARLKDNAGRNEQIVKRNHQKWVAVGKMLESQVDTFKKMSEMQSEILKLKEENMNLEGNLNILKIEAEGMKQSIISAQKIASERQVGVSSVSGLPSSRKFDTLNENLSPRASNMSRASGFTLNSPRGGRDLQFGNKPFF